LNQVAAAWPAAIQQEIAEAGLGEASLALPLDAVEQGLRRGQLSFSWKTLRVWIMSAGLPVVSAHETVHLTLPLSVVAPAFLARRGNAPTPKKSFVDERIPELFEAAPPAAQKGAQRAPGPESRPAPSPKPAAVPLVSRVPPATSALRNRPTPSFRLTPGQLVREATALKGVAGALVALADGLPVASQLAPGLNAETMAAFVPRIYDQVGASVHEFRIGELTTLRFKVGAIPWEIRRVGRAYFSVQGRASEPFPEEALAALARRLDVST
jgi:hypothetical protein